jgi:glutamate carboxypeptidase
MRSWITDRQPLWCQALEELVSCESPSGDQGGIEACAAIARRWFEREVGLGSGQLVHEGGVPSLLLRTEGSAGDPVLLLGHLDTVWETGDFLPLFEATAGRAQGPGIFDMKGGVALALAATAALRNCAQLSGPLTLLLTGDEEVGSGGSRTLIEAEARRHSAVLVLEPPVGEAIKVARKGVGGYRLTVHGRASHAGLEPEKGVNAVVELSALVAQVAQMARPELGTTVSPTVVCGGTRTNVIPAQAHLDVDVRFATAAEAERIAAAMGALRAAHPEARLEIEGGANRPPFEMVSSGRLFALAQEVAAQLHWSGLDGVSAGGGSDGNFTAALGIPTLDGMGIVGGNAHARGEWASLDSIPERSALLAGCLTEIWAGGLS